MPNLLDSFTLLDIFDILILAVLIYNFAIFLKTEIAERVLLFLLFLVFLFYFSIFTGLNSTSWFIRNIFSSSIIILAIIFHADLRRIILSAWRNTPVAEDSRGNGETVDELCKAVGDMAEKRIGALIVIVASIPVDNIIEIGTEIDAKVTSELLNSIFLPYSPIHDGAVIINDGKITKAGCLLPLSKNPDIAKSFGTRHRAALGLSEMVDAMIIVVSEETGKVSLVKDGKIHYDIDENEIRQTVKRALALKRGKKSLLDAEE